MKNYILSGWPTDYENDFAAFAMRKTELSLHRDCILWGNQVVIPQEARDYVLRLLHANHPGMTAMKSQVRLLTWWPKMDKEIEDFVCHCDGCQVNRQSDPKAPVPFWVKPDQPWSRLHIDFAGPVQGEVFLVVVNAFSNWAKVEIMSSMKTFAVISVLRALFATHGVPDVIVSDNGTTFTSDEMQAFLKLNGIRCVYSILPPC